jgi:hypothetical protein
MSGGKGSRGKESMFGIEDPQILLGYALSIGLAVVCIIYGWIKRNEANG